MPGRAYAVTAAMAGGYLLLAMRPAWGAEPLGFVTLCLCLFAGYAAALAAWSEVRGIGWSRMILISGIVFRIIVLVLHPPDLSLDVARYAWDGHLAVSGINPFAFPPAADELTAHRTDFFGDISYKEIPTIYPPVAQVLFAAAALLQRGTTAVRVLLTLCDVGVLLLLVRLLRRARMPEGRLLVYAWCPLPVVEVASSGHVEPLGMLCLLGAALALGAGAPARAGAAWAAAVLTKIGPILLLPILVRRIGARGLAAAVLTAAGLSLPFLSAGAGLFTALGEYSGRWRHNDLLFGLFVAASERLTAWPWMPRLLVAGVVAAVVLRVALRPARHRDGGAAFLLDAATVIAAATLLAPTLHPWYLLWLLPLLCFRPSPPWILLCGSVVLSYLDLARAVSPLPGPSPAMWAEFIPAAVLGVLLALRHGGGLLPLGASSAAAERNETTAPFNTHGVTLESGRKR